MPATLDKFQYRNKNIGRKLTYRLRDGMAREHEDGTRATICDAHDWDYGYSYELEDGSRHRGISINWDWDSEPESDLDTNPYFSDEAQEVFTVNCDVYVKTAVPHTGLPEGAEGVYRGRFNRSAVIDFKTPSGNPYRVALSFDSIRNLYR
jgi:hypothetical protein